MLESLEGKRGQVRYKPPVPAMKGLFGMPTVVNNVVTFVSVPAILARGGRWYRDLGVGRSRGTIPLQLAGNIKRGGLVEVPFGMSLREVLYDFGGGSRSGRPLRAVQVGGPLGAYLPASQFALVSYSGLLHPFRLDTLRPCATATSRANASASSISSMPAYCGR